MLSLLVCSVYAQKCSIAPPQTISVADQIAADQTGLNEGHPHGVPSYWDFYSGPYIGLGNNPYGQTAIEQWGVVYVDATGNPATNSRVNIRNCQLFWKRASTGKWILGSATSKPEVEAYAEDYSSGPYTADVRSEADGTISVTAGNSRNAHFYAPYPRIAIDPYDMGGVVSVCELRLILGNPAGPDDRASARYLGEAGADYYPATTGPGIENNPAIGGGKFKYVESAWRSFAMTTLSQTQLESNPPPVDSTGVLP